MNTISFETLSDKFEILPDHAKKEVIDFVDFLLQKRDNRKRMISDARERRKVLLSLSRRTDEDVQRIRDARDEMNKWQPETF